MPLMNIYANNSDCAGELWKPLPQAPPHEESLINSVKFVILLEGEELCSCMCTHLAYTKGIMYNMVVVQYIADCFSIFKILLSGLLHL